MEYHSAMEKNEVMLFVATWMDLEIIVLSEVRGQKTNTTWYHLYVESRIRHQWTYYGNRLTKHRKQTYGYQRGRKVWEG